MYCHSLLSEFNCTQWHLLNLGQGVQSNSLTNFCLEIPLNTWSPQFRGLRLSCLTLQLHMHSFKFDYAVIQSPCLLWSTVVSWFLVPLTQCTSYALHKEQWLTCATWYRYITLPASFFQNMAGREDASMRKLGERHVWSDHMARGSHRASYNVQRVIGTRIR